MQSVEVEGVRGGGGRGEVLGVRQQVVKKNIQTPIEITSSQKRKAEPQGQPSHSNRDQYRPYFLQHPNLGQLFADLRLNDWQKTRPKLNQLGINQRRNFTPTPRLQLPHHEIWNPLRQNRRYQHQRNPFLSVGQKYQNVRICLLHEGE